uniref:Enhancer of split m4 protein n=1 Tax=Stomoxys calcitrans TaxID=35570 RepID=A0A1I8NUS7_STOCA|nr:unnamed protein product [Stomoxys calcitrans]
MCVEISNQEFNKMNNTTTSNKNNISYSIKKLLKQLFKQQKSTKLDTTLKANESLDSNNNDTSKLECESLADSISKDVLDSSTNELEDFGYSSDHHSALEIEFMENSSLHQQSCDMEDFDFSYVSTTVPVHFLRSEHGTFFWTSNCDIPADNDLAQPMSCSTNNQIASRQCCWSKV